MNVRSFIGRFGMFWDVRCCRTTITYVQTDFKTVCKLNRSNSHIEELYRPLKFEM